MIDNTLLNCVFWIIISMNSNNDNKKKCNYKRINSMSDDIWFFMLRRLDEQRVFVLWKGDRSECVHFYADVSRDILVIMHKYI